MLSLTLLSLRYVMKKSNRTTPRVFSLMRMMSHPRSLAKQFIHSTSEILLDDGVEMVLNCQFPYCSWGWCPILSQCSFCRWCPILSQCSFCGWCLILSQCSFCGWCLILVNLLFVDGVPSWSISPLFMDGVPSWSRHQNYEKGRWVQLLVMSIKFSCR